MSCNEIERRFSIKELDLIIDAFEDVIKENEDYKGRALKKCLLFLSKLHGKKWEPLEAILRVLY